MSLHYPEKKESYRGTVFIFKTLSLQLYFRVLNTKLGECKETHRTHAPCAEDQIWDYLFSSSSTPAYMQLCSVIDRR